MLETLIYLTWLLAAFFIVGPIAFGAYALFFSRRSSVNMLRYRKRVWKIGFTESDVRIGQVYSVVVGAGLVLSGLIVAVQLLS